MTTEAFKQEASRTPNTEMVVKAEPVAYINGQGGVLMTETGEEWFKAIRSTLAPVGSPAAPLYASPPSPAEVTDALAGIKSALGMAEWASPQHAEELLTEIIREWHPRLAALQLNKKG